MTHCRFSLGPGGRKTDVTNSRRHFSRTLQKAHRPPAILGGVVFEPAPPPTDAFECKFRRLLVPAEPTQGVHQGCRTRRLQGGMCATIWLRFYPDSLIARSSASQTVLPLPGSPSIHRPKRRGCSVKVVLRQQPQ